MPTIAATSSNNYALFGGGEIGNSFTDKVNAYEYSVETEFQIYPGTIYKFGGSSEQTSNSWITLAVTSSNGVHGYLKIKDTQVNSAN